jgi:hypothetical protein
LDRPQRLARKQENLTAEKHGGQVTPASGSGGTVKNDVRSASWSLEVKSTSAKTYSLSRDVLATAERNALVDGRLFALVVAFLPTQTRPGQGMRYVVMGEDDFLEREAELTRLREYYETRRVI